jgi:Helix-turn-helix domain
MASSPAVLERREKVNALLQSGMSIAKVAREIGVPPSTIYSDRHTVKQQGAEPVTTTDPVSKGALIKKLKSEGFTALEIVKKTGLSLGTVHHHYHYISRKEGGVNGRATEAGPASQNGITAPTVNHDEETKVAYIFGRISAEIEHLAKRAGLSESITTQRMGKLLLSSQMR